MIKNKIINIKKDSIAEELGIIPNSYLLSVNGKEIYDVLDYKFEMSDDFVTIEIEYNNEIDEYEIEKYIDEDIGLVFEEELINSPKRCQNKCVFCFMDQLPTHMRSTLTFKDDDYRLSFLTGNYVTFSNCSEKDIDRIIKYKLSPINISIHTTNLELRKKMLKNPHADNLLGYIQKLYDNQIYMNGQIVLCPDYNDKEELIKTIKDLEKYIPYMKSICIVPVGLTDYREDLTELRIFTIDELKKTIENISVIQNRFIQKYGSSIVFLSDEFYLKSNTPIPDYSFYEEFPQLENGVGMVSLFKYMFNQRLEELKDQKVICKNKRVSTVTGRLIESTICECASILKEQYNVDIQVFSIDNDFFGKNITVTGLLTGKDIYNQLKDKDLGEKLYICDNMLKDDEDVFLDNMKVKDLSEKLGVEIVIIYNNGADFVDQLLGI